MLGMKNVEKKREMCEKWCFFSMKKLEKVSQNATTTLGKTWKEKAIVLENIFLDQMEKKRECKTYKKSYKKLTTKYESASDKKRYRIRA